MYTSRTIPAVLASAVERYADIEAVVDGDVRWSFAELGEHVRRCAAAVIASGVRQTDPSSRAAPDSG